MTSPKRRTQNLKGAKMQPATISGAWPNGEPLSGVLLGQSPQAIEFDPATVPDYVRQAYAPILPHLRSFGKTIEKLPVNARRAAVSERFGKFLTREVCPKLSMHDGECVVIAETLASESDNT